MYLDKNWPGAGAKLYDPPELLLLVLEVLRRFGKATADSQLGSDSRVPLHTTGRMGTKEKSTQHKKKVRRHKKSKNNGNEWEKWEPVLSWPFGQLQRPTNLSNRTRE